MASTDFTVCNDGLDAATVKKGVTTGIARPPGGGSFLYGFNSIATTAGAVALFTNQTNFAPMAKGASVRGALKRGVSGGNTNFAPLLFAGLGGPSVNDTGYLLGLQDDDPSHIVLRKGALVGGLPAAAVGVSGVLLRSTAAYAIDTWLHLRMDMIVEPNGDVLLQCFANDLTAGGASVATPTWVAIPGMEQFVDDALGVNSGSVPYTSGRGGFGFASKDVTRRGYVDQFECLRQL